ncbi:MAG: c-type cytochrome [Gammaproteobacteria bacterium]|nr:c-type cytochrome [Gammaproteobacteria bacterium]
MKKILIVITLTLGSLSLTPLQASDAAAGANVFNLRGCVGCHGASGKMPIANYPVVGGKPADFVAAELNKFRTGERKNPIMAPMAASLTDVDVDNLAAYLAAQ